MALGSKCRRARGTRAVQREAVIRARLHILLQSLTHLEQIVRGVPLSAQLGLIGRLAIELQQAPDSASVASYQALNDEAGKYVHVLQEGGSNKFPSTLPSF